MAIQNPDHPHATPTLVAPPERRFPLLIVALLGPLIGGTILVGGWAWLHFNSASTAVAFLRGGEVLRLEPEHVDVGAIGIGEIRMIPLRASNLSDGTITINGAPATCARNGCVSWSTRFPLDIPPRSMREVILKAQAPKIQGTPMRLEARLYTSIGTRESSITGEVSDSELDAKPKTHR